MSSTSNSLGLKGPLTVLSVLVVLYSLIIAQQILLGLIVVAAFWFLYLLYRLVLRLGRLVTALERLVELRIQEENGWDSEA